MKGFIMVISKRRYLYLSFILIACVFCSYVKSAEKKPLHITLSGNLKNTNNKYQLSRISRLIILNHQNKIIWQKIFDLFKPLILKNLPNDIYAIKVIPVPIEEKVLAAASKVAVNIVKGVTNYKLPVTILYPKKITIVIKGHDGKAPKNRNLTIYDLTYGKTNKQTVLSTINNGKSIFYGYPGQKYQIGFYISSPLQILEETSPVYIINAAKKEYFFYWRIKPWKTAKISFYQDKGGKISLMTEINRINLYGNHTGSSFPVTNGSVEVNLKKGRFAKSKSLKIVLAAQEEMADYKIIKGQEFLLKDKNNKHVVIMRKEFPPPESIVKAYDSLNKKVVASELYYAKIKEKNYYSSGLKKVHKLPPGRYRIVLYTPGYKFVKRDNLTISSKVSQTIKLKVEKGVNFTGVIRNWDTNHRRAAFLIYSSFPDISPLPVPISRDNGNFQINCDPELRPLLVATQENKSTYVAPLLKGKNNDKLEIKISRGLILKGQLPSEIMKNQDVSKGRFKVIFGQYSYGIVTSGSKVLQDGSWSVQLMPGKYFMLLLQSGQVITLKDNIVVNNKDSIIKVEWKQGTVMTWHPLKEVISEKIAFRFF